MRFSDNGRLLAVWGRKTAVFDAVTGERQYELPSAGNIPSVMTDKTGHACEQIVGFDDEGRVWAIAFTLNSRPAKRSLVRFSLNGDSLEPVIPDLQLSGPVQPLTAVLSPDRRLLSIVGDAPKIGEAEDICVWNIATSQSRRFEGSHDHMGSLAFSPDGHWLASVSQTGGPVKIWELKW
jgi:WD40 repeat protein